MGRHPTGSDIVVFDGFCNFCSGSVQFIIRRDPGSNFRFAASQSPAGKKLLEQYGLGDLASRSIILIRDGKIYRRSGAVLRISRRMNGLWPAFYGFIIVPRFIRDFLYDLFARNRYRFYGMRDSCFLPDPGIRERFLDRGVGEGD